MHVNNTSRSCFYELTQLRSIRRPLSMDFAKTSVHIKSCRSLQQFFLQCHRRCHEKTAICPQRRSQVDLEQEKVWPYHSCAEGSSPLVYHPSAYRFCSLSTTPFMVEVRHTSTAPAIPSERLARGLTCDLLSKATWLCLEPGFVALGPETSLSRDRLFGTHCPRTFELRNCHWSVSNLCWKHIFSRSICLAALTTLLWLG